jgi:metallo-beta-lactamase family protein
LSSSNTIRIASPLVEEGAARRDWHNDYASFLLDLGERLRSAPNEASRRNMLSRLSDALC